MELKDATSLFHFRELHLLPRVMFFIGAAFLVGSFFVKTFILGLAGVGVLLAATTMNLAVDAILRLGHHFKNRAGYGIPWALLWQTLIGLALTVATLSLTFYFYRHGEMPSWLRPMPKDHIDFRPEP